MRSLPVSKCLVVVVACIAGELAAEALPKNVEDRFATAEAIKRESHYDARDESAVFNIRRSIEGTYRVPLSYEWSFVGPDRESVDSTPFRMDLVEGETLREVLDRFCGLSEGQFMWQRTPGVVCVQSSSSAGQTESSLDTVVSLRLDEVSTWEAFVALGTAVNEVRETNRVFSVYPHFYSNFQKGPKGFRDRRDISLVLSDVTAREALWAIIEASHLRMSYWYWNYYRPHEYPESTPKSRLTIWTYENGTRYWTHRKMNRELFITYMEEIAAVKAVEPAR